MEDTACAAALLLAFAGESSLRTRCSEIVRLAGELEHAAVAVEAPCKGLAAVARMLSDADADDVRMEAVMSLEETAIKLEEATAALHHASGLGKQGPLADARVGLLGCRANRLVLACQNYRRVADPIPLVRHAATEAERARQQAAAKAERAEAERARQQAAAEAARERQHAAAESERARQHAAAEAEREEAERARQHAAAEAERMWREERRPTRTGRWWSFPGRRRPDGRRDDIEDPFIDKSDPPTPSPSATGNSELGQGESKRSVMNAYALYGSVTLLTYLGPENVIKRVSGQSHSLRKSFHIAFSLWWTLQATGVPLSAYTRSLFELRFSQVLCRLGMLGINLLVIVFLYFALNINSKITLWLLLGVAAFLHLLSFVVVYRRGDLSK